jgi:DNA-binding LytR/AlgR family response regulator
MIKAVIIEDEQLIAKELANKIAAVADDVEIIESLPSLKTAKKWFMNNAEPDLLFMDIQLSDGVSFELFDHFKLSCPVIFTTAYDEYAIRAFKVNGIDYLLKPIDEADLQKAIDKCRSLLQVKPVCLQICSN